MARLRGFLQRRHRDERGAALIFTAISHGRAPRRGRHGRRRRVSPCTAAGRRRPWPTPPPSTSCSTSARPTRQSTNTAIQTYLNGAARRSPDRQRLQRELTVTPGVWQSGTFSTPSTGCAGTVFRTPPPPCNAVEVTASQAVPQIFWGGFNTLDRPQRERAPLPRGRPSRASPSARTWPHQHAADRRAQRPPQHPGARRPA